MGDSDNQSDNSSTIKLSHMAEALVESISQQKPAPMPLEGEIYEVSQAVSFFGFAYEKARNSIEFNEEHLIRRLAIARVLKRRLALNPEGRNEGENIGRELLWGRYIQQKVLTHSDIDTFQRIIDAYIGLFNDIKSLYKVRNVENLGNIIIDLMSTEIEEVINKEHSAEKSAELYFFYQTLKNKINIPEVEEDVKDTFFYVATEKAFAKNDIAFITYHLFTLRYGQLYKQDSTVRKHIAESFNTFIQDIDTIFANPYDEKLVKFARKQVAPFRILYTLLEDNKNSARSILTNTELLKQKVSEICAAKYEQTGVKLRNAAIRSITYIFLTKMVFVLLFEIPLTQLFYNEIEYISLGMNLLFPPLLMGLIVTFINPPSDKNTERIYNRVVDILDRDPGFETRQTTFAKNSRVKRPVLFAIFTLLYLMLFSLVFGSLYGFLDSIGFNIISKTIFLFFITVVAFFGYRIRQTAKEYVLETQNNIVITFVTFLFLPILYVGKFFSNQVSKINVFIIFFDYLIEAPFKFFIEIIEEWSKFIKARKEELV